MTVHWLCPRCTEIRDTERPRGCANAACPSPAEVMTIADPAPAIRYVGGAARFLRDLVGFALVLVAATCGVGAFVWLVLDAMARA